MAKIPPWPQEFLVRLVGDAVVALRFDETPVRRQVAAALPGENPGIAEAEERALEALEERWRELAPALAAALGGVEAEYAHHAARVAEARRELDALAADSWIARAVRARLAFDIGFDALGDIGALVDL